MKTYQGCTGRHCILVRLFLRASMNETHQSAQEQGRTQFTETGVKEMKTAQRRQIGRRQQTIKICEMQVTRIYFWVVLTPSKKILQKSPGSSPLD